MNFRVYFKNDLPIYCKTKLEATLYQRQNGGEIQRKIGGEWVGYKKPGTVVR